MADVDDVEDTDDPFHFDATGLAPSRPVRDDRIVRDETFVDAFDDERLFCQVWSRADEAPDHGVVPLIHGYGEHSSRYDHVAAAFVRAGYAVIAIDARGAGRSTGKRAFVEDFDHYVRDYRTLVERARERWPELPLFGLGHSNGGLTLLRYALAHDRAASELSGIVVTSPFLGFQVDVPAHKAAAARIMSRVWPSFSMPNDLDPNHLSHDSHVVETYDDDPLVLRIATARWFTEALEAQADLRERAGDIDHPALFLVAGADELADPSVAEDIFHDLGAADREMEVFPNLYHEVLNEPNWARTADRIIDWMHRLAPTATAEDAA